MADQGCLLNPRPCRAYLCRVFQKRRKTLRHSGRVWYSESVAMVFRVMPVTAAQTFPDSLATKGKGWARFAA